MDFYFRNKYLRVTTRGLLLTQILDNLRVFFKYYPQYFTFCLQITQKWDNMQAFGQN